MRKGEGQSKDQTNTNPSARKHRVRKHIYTLAIQQHMSSNATMYIIASEGDAIAIAIARTILVRKFL